MAIPHMQTKRFARKRLHQSILLGTIAAAFPVVSHASATVEFALGNVSAIGPAGTQRSLSKGAQLQAGETISTGKDGRAQLRFSDGALMSLQPDTEFRIDSYTYNDKADGKEQGFFSLIKGGLRTITGLIGRSNKQAYKLNTAVATVGIRGTEYAVFYTGGTEGTLNVATGEGEIAVCNPGGCVFVSGGESAIVTGPNSQPRRTEVLPTLPPQAASRNLVVAMHEGDHIPLADGSLYPPTEFSVSENRTPSGGIPPVSAPLVNGSNYNISYAGIENGSPAYGNNTGTVSASFAPYSALLQFTDSGANTFKAKAIATSFAMDGIVGWGRWLEGDKTGGIALKDTHYVIGLPTPSMPQGGSASYKLAGYTTPTHSVTGLAGALLGGSLTMSWGMGYTGTLKLDLAYNGTTYNTSSPVNGSGNTAYISASVAGYLQFFGNNASHAGIAYETTVTGGKLHGTAVFKQ